MRTPGLYHAAAAFACLLTLASCAVTPKPAHEHLTLKPASFADLDGWNNDTPAAALLAFRLSCPAFGGLAVDASLGIAGKVAAWQAACAAAEQIPGDDDAAARAYFETWFRPYAAAGNAGTEGLFTGYYVPELNGALQRGGTFQTPLYQRPGDMISVDLGAFKSDLKGQHIVGKVSGTQLTPYDARADITRGSLTGRAEPLVWIDDPVGVFFLQVQGSGHIRLTDGSVMPVGYDGANGRAYVAIGRVMADRGDLPRPVTMQAIRDWLKAHPERAGDVMNINPSYVFFRRLPNNDIIGAQGVALTPGRSMAVDPLFVPLGVPLWLETTDGQDAPLHRLMVAQDTGGAIKGPVRGDVFWGAGEAAGAEAGMMQSQGRYYLLLPKAVNIGDD